MNSALHLRRHGPLFKLQLPRVHHGAKAGGTWSIILIGALNDISTHTHTHACDSPEDTQTLGSDILAAMLDTSYQVRYELLDGALVLDRARHPLGHLHLVALAVETPAFNPLLVSQVS